MIKKIEEFNKNGVFFVEFNIELGLQSYQIVFVSKDEKMMPKKGHKKVLQLEGGDEVLAVLQDIATDYHND